MRATRAYLDAAGRRTAASISVDCAFMQVMNTLLANIQSIPARQGKIASRTHKAMAKAVIPPLT